MVKPQRILLVGGGSGGHVAPILALYNKLKQKDSSLNLLIVGTGGQVEQQFYQSISEYRKIYAGKLHRVLTWRNIPEVIKLTLGLFQSLYLLVRFSPDKIFSKGGYASLPIIFWAKILRIPYSLHESDIDMGYSNRFAASSAQKIFTGFNVSFYNRYSWKDKVVFTGQLIEKAKTEDFIYQFDHKKPVILITGGSQGSKIINETLIKALPQLLSSYYLIHQTGSLSYADVIKEREKLSNNEKESYYVNDFFDNNTKNHSMQSAIAESDLVITRCGLNTLAEIAMARKPIIMIPYKHSAGNHQMKNALEIAKKTDLPIIKDDDLTAETLIKCIKDLFEKKADFSSMTAKYKEIFPENGLEIVADYLLKGAE
jgi:UDP-N-acetylglucosamine--N-acetylmuramyl-(pentapeptide) pyrophosphoryl-undecaprenol N-acetylglucosamine transferase